RRLRCSNAAATDAIYTLSLHDALPICMVAARKIGAANGAGKNHVTNPGHLCLRLVEHHMPGRVAGAVDHVERDITDRDGVTVFQPAVRRKGATRRKAEHL